jgi:hypothetical protein
VSFDNGATYDNLGGIVDASVSIEVDELECTTHDSNGIRAWIPNHQAATMDVSMRWDEDDPQQVSALFTLFPSPTSFKIQFVMEEATGRRRFDADAFITNFAPSGPLDDTASADMALRLSNLALAVQ